MERKKIYIEPRTCIIGLATSDSIAQFVVTSESIPEGEAKEFTFPETDEDANENGAMRSFDSWKD